MQSLSGLMVPPGFSAPASMHAGQFFRIHTDSVSGGSLTERRTYNPLGEYELFFEETLKSRGI